MKFQIPAAFILLVFFSSCESVIIGHGDVITKNISAESIREIHTDVVSNITLMQDDGNEFVEISGYENLIPVFNVRSENGVTDIRMESHSHIFRNNIKIVIHAKSPELIEMNGVGNLKTSGSFMFDKLKITLNGVGNVEMNGSGHMLKLTSNGVGNIQARGVKADSVFAKTDGVGNIYCSPQIYLKASVGGVGSIHYSGNPTVDKNVSGVGSVRHDD